MIHSVLTDNELSFEGIRRPALVFSVAEGLPTSREHIAILERYFTDIHNLFEKKMIAFTEGKTVMSQDTVKLQALLQEMIKVKGLIESATSAIDAGSAGKK